MQRLSKEGLAFRCFLPKYFIIAMTFNTNKLLAYLMEYQLEGIPKGKKFFAKFL
ncbi:hypothetical protein Hanom_Chr10g00873191 [Helianthus anomalus]